jgi:hypothetical protein
MWDGMTRCVNLIWVRWEQKYFCGGDWTTQISLKPKENFSYPDSGHGAAIGPEPLDCLAAGFSRGSRFLF